MDRRALCTFLLLLSCGDQGSKDGAGGDGSPAKGSLTITDAVPASGNAVLDAPTVVHETGLTAEGLDALRISQSVAGVEHAVSVYWLPGTPGARSFTHTWQGVMVGCCEGPSPCQACGAAVVVDEAARTVTVDRAVLPDLLGGSSTSTVSGSVRW